MISQITGSVSICKKGTIMTKCVSNPFSVRALLILARGKADRDNLGEGGAHRRVNHVDWCS